MALNIGLAFLQRGYNVHWLTRDPARLNQQKPLFERQVKRLFRRHFDEKASPEWSLSEYSGFSLDSPASLIIETTVEDLSIKRQSLLALSRFIDDQTLVMSNSSSILPSLIHESCLGCHFFYPIELNPFVELVVPAGLSSHGLQVKQILQAFSWRVIVQDEAHAYWINQLLLPMQAIALESLKQGANPQKLEIASQSKVLPLGILSTIDSIGIDVFTFAVIEYVNRMPLAQGDMYGPMIATLQELLHLGKLGAKNGNGLLIGEPLPWALGLSIMPDFESIARQSIQSTIARGHISMDDMRYVLREFWGSSYDPGKDRL
jgi:3-hydroxyacyl-CoA dehydrogenase